MDDSESISPRILLQAGMVGGEACGFYPPGGKGVLLVDWEECPDGGGKWALIARTPDHKLDIVMTAETIGQVRKACDLAGCPLPAAKEESAENAEPTRFGPPKVGMQWDEVEAKAAHALLATWQAKRAGRMCRVDRCETRGRVQIHDGDKVDAITFHSSQHFHTIAADILANDPRQAEKWEGYDGTARLLDRWKERADGRGWRIDLGSRYIVLSETGKPTSSLRLATPLETEVAVEKLLADDPQRPNSAECSLTGDKCPAAECPPECPKNSPCDTQATCGETPTADELSDEWLAGGDDAGEIRGVAIGKLSNGQCTLSVRILPSNVSPVPLAEVRRDYYDEDATPYLRSAIRELREVHGMGYDDPPTKPADDVSGI